MTPSFIDLTQIEGEPVRWLWPSRIPCGALTLLVGYPGTGKSTLLSDVAARITTGRPMFDCTGWPKRQEALLISGEDDPGNTIRPRLRSAGADIQRVRILDTTTDQIQLPSDLPSIERELADSHAGLIVIDPLMQFLEGNVNSDSSVRRALSPLARLGRRTGAAIVLIHHPPKSASGSVLHQSAGSIGLLGLVRSALLVMQLPGEDVCVLSQFKNNLGPLARSLAFRRADRAGIPVIEWIGASEYSAEDLAGMAGRVPAPELDEAVRVLFAILGSGDVEAKIARTLATSAGISASTLKRAKKALGVVSVRRGFGPGSCFYWRLPEEHHPLVQRLRDDELSELSDRLFHGDDDDPADWWKRPS